MAEENSSPVRGCFLAVILLIAVILILRSLITNGLELFQQATDIPPTTLTSLPATSGNQPGSDEPATLATAPETTTTSIPQATEAPPLHVTPLPESVAPFTGASGDRKIQIEACRISTGYDRAITSPWDLWDLSLHVPNESPPQTCFDLAGSIQNNAIDEVLSDLGENWWPESDLPMLPAPTSSDCSTTAACAALCAVEIGFTNYSDTTENNFELDNYLATHVPAGGRSSACKVFQWEKFNSDLFGENGVQNSLSNESLCRAGLLPSALCGNPPEASNPQVCTEYVDKENPSIEEVFNDSREAYAENYGDISLDCLGFLRTTLEKSEIEKNWQAAQSELKTCVNDVNKCPDWAPTYVYASSAACAESINWPFEINTLESQNGLLAHLILDVAWQETPNLPTACSEILTAALAQRDSAIDYWAILLHLLSH